MIDATDPLHPNLARIAAAYDDIHRRYGLRQLSADDAKAEILALQARDDDGVIWRISPNDGSWLRRTRDGQWVRGTPPPAGLATPTAHDLSRDPRVFNPDRNIAFRRVADQIDGIHGATRQLTDRSDAASNGRRWQTVTWLVVAVMVAVGWRLLT